MTSNSAENSEDSPVLFIIIGIAALLIFCIGAMFFCIMIRRSSDAALSAPVSTSVSDSGTGAAPIASPMPVVIVRDSGRGAAPVATPVPAVIAEVVGKNDFQGNNVVTAEVVQATEDNVTQVATADY